MFTTQRKVTHLKQKEDRGSLRIVRRTNIVTYKKRAAIYKLEIIPVLLPCDVRFYARLGRKVMAHRVYA